MNSPPGLGDVLLYPDRITDQHVSVNIEFTPFSHGCHPRISTAVAHNTNEGSASLHGLGKYTTRVKLGHFDHLLMHCPTIMKHLSKVSLMLGAVVLLCEKGFIHFNRHMINLHNPNLKRDIQALSRYCDCIVAMTYMLG